MGRQQLGKPQSALELINKSWKADQQRLPQRWDILMLPPCLRNCSCTAATKPMLSQVPYWLDPDYVSQTWLPGLSWDLPHHCRLTWVCVLLAVLVTLTRLALLSRTVGLPFGQHSYNLCSPCYHAWLPVPSRTRRSFPSGATYSCCWRVRDLTSFLHIQNFLGFWLLFNN